MALPAPLRCGGFHYCNDSGGHMLSIYVASAYSTAPAVRDLHDALRAIGCTVLSTWAETANGADDVDALSDEEADAAWDANHTAARCAHLVIVMADSGGRETFAEAASALAAQGTLIWVGRETLSARAHRTQVTRVATVADALAIVAGVVAQRGAA